MEVIDKWHNTIIDAQVLIPLTLDVWVTVEDNAQARVRLLGCASLWLPMSSLSSLLQPTLNLIVLIGRRANDLLRCIQPELHLFSDEWIVSSPLRVSLCFVQALERHVRGTKKCVHDHC